MKNIKNSKLLIPLVVVLIALGVFGAILIANSDVHDLGERSHGHGHEH